MDGKYKYGHFNSAKFRNFECSHAIDEKNMRHCGVHYLEHYRSRLEHCQVHVASY